MLSYSFSRHCPPEKQNIYLKEAREAFENGLLTKKDEEVVTSQQELQTLLRAAFSLAVTDRWLTGPAGDITAALDACQDGLALLYSYCFSEDSDKPALSADIMLKVQRIKKLLNVTPLTNSDPRSFIPDSYRITEDKAVPFSTGDFSRAMQVWGQNPSTMRLSYFTHT